MPARGEAAVGRRLAGNAGGRTGLRSARGFTLVEMLVAVAVFAVASLLAYGGLASISRARADLEAANTRFGRLQFAIGLLERDVRSVAARGVREGYGTPSAALVGTRDRIELTRYGWANALALPRSELERVAWSVQQGSLMRQRYAVLDRTPGTRPLEDALLDGVERIEWRYLARDGRTLPQWPPPRSGDEEPPIGVEVVVTLTDLGEIRRVLELPETAP